MAMMQQQLSSRRSAPQAAGATHAAPPPRALVVAHCGARGLAPGVKVVVAPFQAAGAHPCGRVSVRPSAGAKKGFGKVSDKKVVGDPAQPCPCGSGKLHADCCQPFLNKEAKPATAEQLLRSRYTAYAIKNAEYIADTTHPESPEYTGSRATYLQSVRQTQRRADWLGLVIEKQEAGQTPNEALISFKAYYVDKQDKSGKRQERTEVSRFKREAKSGEWRYMGSDLLEESEPVGGLQLPTFQLPSIKFN